MLYRHLPLVTAAVLTLAACRSDIKNPDAEVLVEPGARADTAFAKMSPGPGGEPTAFAKTVIGYWVGDFEPERKEGEDLSVFAGEREIWNRANKINLSIDRLTRDSVFGHSVVAGNDRPFEGTLTQDAGGAVTFAVREPGDNRYDGAFDFVIDDGVLTGAWQAYEKVEIPRRTYALRRRDFAYDPGVRLERREAFVDWNRFRETAEVEEIDGDTYEWMERTYAASTPAAFELNASAGRLTEAQVANLKRGDLVIIRNAIYARHGYSFRERPLRVFFDQQDWYIPVHADITSDFTPVELANIKLLLRYEGNAAEYYDRFGRG